jgi:single-stranded-DNA-specific exonuclease
VVIILNNKWYIEKAEINNKIDGVDPVIRRILYNRGIREEKEVKKFLFSNIDDLYNPYMMTDMNKGVERIINAIELGERIIIYGDYDVDGITSSSLLYLYFKTYPGVELNYYLPDRFNEGYGLNIDAIKGIIEQSFDLLITVDCGVRGNEEIEFARNNGLDVIVTDHHQPGETLPPALAVINPHRNDDSYPFRELAGVGVAFKLVQAIEEKTKGSYLTGELIKYLDLVALGTIADLVPLIDENRILVREGLKILNNKERIGLKALINSLGLNKKELNAGQVGYILAPPLNAAGRMESANIGVKLLISKSYEEAEDLSKKLVNFNNYRKKEEKRIFKEALLMLEDKLDEDKCIVLASSEWHSGVIGIVASRLVEKFYLPTILITINEGIGKGSCRSIPGLNIYDALSNCSQFIDSFGGHAQAAGMTIKEEYINVFKNNFNNYLNKVLDEESLIPHLRLEGVLNPLELNLELYRKIEMIEPFGIGNPKPRFLLNNVDIQNCYTIGKENGHIKFSLNNGINGIGFGFGDMKKEISEGKVDLAFSLSINEWNNKKKLQLEIRDINIRNESKYHPVYFKIKDWLIADKRGCRDKLNYLEKLYLKNNKIVLYINKLSLIKTYINTFNDRGKCTFIQDEIQKFNKAERGILFLSNSLFNDYISSNNIVLISLPFSLENLAEIIIKLSMERPNIHLLYGEKELICNKNIIKNKLPTDSFLKSFYNYLESFAIDKNISTDILLERNKNKINNNLIKSSLTIFKELGLLKISGDKLCLLHSPEEKLDLSDSMSYNKIIQIINRFNIFSNLSFSDDLFKYIEGLEKLLYG